MKNLLSSLFLITTFIVIEFDAAVFAQINTLHQSVFQTDTLSMPPYVTRKKFDETEFKRYFGIGTNLLNWPESNSTNLRYCDSLEFTSAKEIFTVLNNPYPEIWPSYYEANPAEYDCLFLTGNGHLHWRMRMDTVFNTYPNIPTEGWYIGPTDQDSAYQRECITGTLKAVVFSVKEKCKDRGDFLLYLADEPERGQNGSWYFHDSLLIHLRRINNDTLGYLTLIGLGPIDGNMLVYDYMNFAIPLNNLQRYDTSHYQYTSFPEADSNLRLAFNYYDSACDIISFNSYRYIANNPANIGFIIDLLMGENPKKPVWPWISTKHSIYGDIGLEDFRGLLRRQVFTAIAHRASGILFYSEEREGNDPDWDIIKGWDVVLDIAKELQYYRNILELKSYYDWNYSHLTHWRTLKHGTKYFLFAVNNSDTSEIISPSKFPNTLVDEGEAAVWFNDDALNSSRKLKMPRNLGFESPLEIYTNWVGELRFRNWVAKTTGRAESKIDYSERKIGKNSLRLSITNDNSESINKASAEQFGVAIPSATYKLKAWYKHKSGNEQRMILQFYNSNFIWLEEHSILSGTKQSWEIIEKDINAPAGAYYFKIMLYSGDFGTSSANWDDISLQMKVGNINF